MTKKELALYYKNWLLNYTKDFLEFIWTDGTDEGVLIFFEHYGKRYQMDNVMLLREFNLLTEEEEEMFFELEEALFEQLEMRDIHKFYICFTSPNYKKIEAARQKIIKHFNIDMSVRGNSI